MCQDLTARTQNSINSYFIVRVKDSNTKLPTASGNNIWYNGGDGVPVVAPSWDTNPITADPLFTDPENGDFTLQESSPAIDSGTNLVSQVVLRDYQGTQKPIDGDNNGSAEFDIGPYEFFFLNAYHDADLDEDGNISTNEIRTYITQWKSSKVLLASVADAISIWKS